jgi:hypothetical protein
VLVTSIKHSTRNTSKSNQTRKKNKKHQIGKYEVKLPWVADDMILYVENFDDSIQKKSNLCELMNKFSKVAGYKNHLHFFTSITIFLKTN